MGIFTGAMVSKPPEINALPLSKAIMFTAFVFHVIIEESDQRGAALETKLIL